MEYIDPQKARQERERQERERQARIKAAREAKIEAEKKRQAKIKAEQKRQAKLKAEHEAKLKAEQEAAKKAQKVEPESKKPTEPKPDPKKPIGQKPEDHKDLQSSSKNPDEETQTEITWSKPGEASPIYGPFSPIHSSISSLYGQSSVPISKGSEPKPKPEVPSDRMPRNWSGEKVEPQAAHKPYKPRDLSGIKQAIAEGRAQKEQKKQEQIQNTLQHYPGIQNILQQPSFFNGSLALGTTLTNPLMGATLLSGAQSLGQPEKTQTSEPIKVASAHGHGIIMPATPEQQLHHQFEIDVAAKAQRLLKANKDRLNIEQKVYAQDNNSKSDRWSHLWQVASQRREFQTQQANLQTQLEVTTQEMSNLSDIPDGTGLMSTPEQRQNSPKHKKLVALGEQKRQMRERIEQAKQMQVSLEYAYPALAAVKNETGANAADMQAVQGRLPQEFNGIRKDIDRISQWLTDEPSKAWLFDSVVAAQLKDKSLSPSQRQQLAQQAEKAHPAGGIMLGAVLSGGLFAASFVPLLQDIAIPLLWAGIGMGGAVAAAEVPDLLLLDGAAQAGRGGAGKLTGQSPEQARFNLVMGYANVALAGLDVAAEGRVIYGLKGLVGRLSGQGAQVLRETWVQVMRLAAQGEVGIAKARVLLAKAKGMSGAMVDEVLEVLSPMEKVAGVGKMSRQEMRGNTAQVTTEEAIKTAKAKKPPKAFEAYANAPTVKPFIGTKVDPNNLPPGYLYGKMPLENGKFREVIYLPKSDGDMVPLKLDAKGFIKKAPEGEYRIVNKTAYDKNVVTDPGKRGKLLGGDSEVHHLYADNLLRKTPFGQRALKLGAFNPDAGPNLIELANSTKNLEKARAAHPDVQFSDFVHNTQHPEFDRLMEGAVNEEIRALRDAKGLSRIKEADFIQQMTKEEIKEVLDESLTNVRRGLMNEDKALYKDLKKRTRPSGSLAQGESLDNSEVA